MSNGDLSEPRDVNVTAVYKAAIYVSVCTDRVRFTIIGETEEVCLVGALLSSRMPRLRLWAEGPGMQSYEDVRNDVYC